MRLSDLSAASGVPVATVKYYLREGLVPPGRLTAATQAQYAASHLPRPRLVRGGGGGGPGGDGEVLPARGPRPAWAPDRCHPGPVRRQPPAAAATGTRPRRGG